VPAHDPLHGRKTQPPARAFGGEERIEKARLRRFWW
jgi:hypothetical protein